MATVLVVWSLVSFASAAGQFRWLDELEYYFTFQQDGALCIARRAWRLLYYYYILLLYLNTGLWTPAFISLHWGSGIYQQFYGVQTNTRIFGTDRKSPPISAEFDWWEHAVVRLACVIENFITVLRRRMLWWNRCQSTRIFLPIVLDVLCLLLMVFILTR